MELPNLWLASSGIPPDVISCFILMMKAKRHQSDDPILVTLRRMLYSQFGFITAPSRLSMLAKGGIALFLMRALLKPALKVGMIHQHLYRPYGYMIHRVIRKYTSPSHHITQTMQILSNPHFQMPIFHLNFGIEDISEWGNEFRIVFLTNILYTIPDDFVGLPILLLHVCHLMITNNPLWNNLVDLFINNDLLFPDVLKKFEDDCKTWSLSGSHVYRDFERIFQHIEPELELVPNDCLCLLKIVEKLLDCMVNNLPIFPSMNFDQSTYMMRFLVNFELSPDGIKNLSRIYGMMKPLHSLSISETFMSLLEDINHVDSPKCLIYRGLKVLFRMILLLKQSNSVLYTYIHAYILVETSESGKKQICAWRNLFTIVNAHIIEPEQDEYKNYSDFTVNINCFLLNRNYYDHILEYNDEVISFFIDIISTPEFLSFPQKAAACVTRKMIKKFAKKLMRNERIVGIFRKYIQENPKTWARC
jgi:hypothetical protein